MLVRMATRFGWTEPEFIASLPSRFGIASPDFIPVARYEEVCEAIEAGMDAPLARREVVLEGAQPWQ